MPRLRPWLVFLVSTALLLALAACNMTVTPPIDPDGTLPGTTPGTLPGTMPGTLPGKPCPVRRQGNPARNPSTHRRSSCPRRSTS